MNNKIILPVFAVLFLLGAIPFGFTALPEATLFGWMPLALAYWWGLMGINLVFVLLVSKHFLNTAKKGGNPQ